MQRSWSHDEPKHVGEALRIKKPQESRSRITEAMKQKETYNRGARKVAGSERRSKNTQRWDEKQ